MRASRPFALVLALLAASLRPAGAGARARPSADAAASLAAVCAAAPLRDADDSPASVRAPSRADAVRISPEPTREEAAALVREIGELMRTQRPDGSYAPSEALRFYVDVPLVATLALSAARATEAPAFTARAAASIERWYRLRFSRDDTDGDLLVEHVADDDYGVRRRVASPGECALVALDLEALAALHLELRRPLDALYWYDGARALRRAVVATTFDPDAAAFYPVTTPGGETLHRRDALDLAPALFALDVGANHAARLAASVDRAAAWPGSPAPVAWLNATGDAPALARAAVVLGVVARARADRAREMATALARRTPGPPEPGAVAPAAARVLWRWCASGRGLREPVATPVRIVSALARARRPLPDVDLVRFESALERVAEIAERGPGDVDPGAEAAVRTAYAAVSALREVADAIFTERDRYALAGVSGPDAFRRTLDDALDVVRRAEAIVSRARRAPERLRVSATLLTERTVPGRPTLLRWTVTTGAREVEIVRLVAHVAGRADTLVRSPVRIRPGGAGVSVQARVPVDDARVPALVPVRATLEVVDATGRRTKHPTMRTVWIEPPVSARMLFPAGRRIGEAELPIDVEFVRRVDEPVRVTCAWRSVAGLLLREGVLTQVDVDADTVRARFHVVPTHPLRPGAFPFTMAFGVDAWSAGAVRSQLVHPFEWIGVGPFARGGDPMRVEYPPERSLDLLGSWSGRGVRVRWRPVPPEATRPDGWIDVGPLLGEDGVAFLYTVVRSEAPVELPVRFEATGPARLFVNGRRVTDANATGAPTESARTSLRAGINDILVKVVGNRATRVRLTLGDPTSLAPDALDNDVASLIDGFDAFLARNAAVDSAIVRRTVVLRYEDARAQSVAVIGSFNGWSPRATPMRAVGPGRWEVSLSLEPGRYAYRFLVDGRRQVLDPAHPLREPDGFGGENSVLVVRP